MDVGTDLGIRRVRGQKASAGLGLAPSQARYRGHLQRTKHQYQGAPNWYNRAVMTSGKFRIPADRWRHITHFHAHGAPYPNKSHFASGADIRTLIRRAVRGAPESGSIMPNQRKGTGGWCFDLDHGRTIGTTITGTPTSVVRVVLKPNGNVWTAFPIP